MTSFSDEIARWEERGPDVVPIYCPVVDADIEALVKIAFVHQDLIDFWRDRGCANFNTDSQGRSVSTWITNQLLEPSEIIFLLQETCGIVEDLLPHGLPFFNMFDLEYLVINFVGAIISPNPDGSETLIAANLQDFVRRLTEWPVFYDDVD